MTTFFIYWILASLIGAGINYVIMRDTDNDRD